MPIIDDLRNILAQGNRHQLHQFICSLSDHERNLLLSYIDPNEAGAVLHIGFPDYVARFEALYSHARRLVHKRVPKDHRDRCRTAHELATSALASALANDTGGEGTDQDTKKLVLFAWGLYCRYSLLNRRRTSNGTAAAASADESVEGGEANGAPAEAGAGAGDDDEVAGDADVQREGHGGPRRPGTDSVAEIFQRAKRRVDNKLYREQKYLIAERGAVAKSGEDDQRPLVELAVERGSCSEGSDGDPHETQPDASDLVAQIEHFCQAVANAVSVVVERLGKDELKTWQTDVDLGSYRKAAMQLGLSLHKVRRVVQRVQEEVARNLEQRGNLFSSVGGQASQKTWADVLTRDKRFWEACGRDLAAWRIVCLKFCPQLELPVPESEGSRG